MKRDSVIRHFLLALAGAIVLYLAAYFGIEHFRSRRGGWQVTFHSDTTGTPSVSISHPRLSISNVAILFPDERLAFSNSSSTVVFNRPTTNTPFGRVVYLDTTFLPGSVVLDFYSNQVELLPRALIINSRELPWQSGSTVQLSHRDRPGALGQEKAGRQNR